MGGFRTSSLHSTDVEVLLVSLGFVKPNMRPWSSAVKRVECPLQVSIELLPQVEEFKYLQAHLLSQALGRDAKTFEVTLLRILAQ